MAKIRQWFYLISSLIASVAAILVTAKLISQGQADSVLDLVEVLGPLLGGGAAGTAGWILNRQRKDGVLDTPAPADAAITAIEQTVQAASNATADVERVKKAASEVLGQVPGIGPLAQQAIDRLKLG